MICYLLLFAIELHWVNPGSCKPPFFIILLLAGVKGGLLPVGGRFTDV